MLFSKSLFDWNMSSNSLASGSLSGTYNFIPLQTSQVPDCIYHLSYFWGASLADQHVYPFSQVPVSWTLAEFLYIWQNLCQPLEVHLSGQGFINEALLVCSIFVVTVSIIMSSYFFFLISTKKTLYLFGELVESRWCVFLWAVFFSFNHKNSSVSLQGNGAAIDPSSFEPIPYLPLKSADPHLQSQGW